VIDVTLAGRHATPDEDTGLISSFDETFQRLGRLAGGRPDGDEVSVVVSDRIPEFGVGMITDNLSGDVGDNRPHAREVNCLVGERGQGFE
jgi:hypothetical protein